MGGGVLGERFVRVVLRAPSPLLAERAAAEAFEAGATGVEERSAGVLHVYAPEAIAAALRAALTPFEAEGLACAQPEPVAEVDWSRAWRDGLEAVEISPRLLVRPPFVAACPRPGQAEVVIEPGQAFGTGGHASTRLALVLLAALDAHALAGTRILDVGTGTGVLSLAALRLGAHQAVSLDLDPLAARAARENAAANGLAACLKVVAGPLEALRASPFDGALANLLRSELLPILPDLARAVRPGGFVIASGLLASERAVVESALAAEGLCIEDMRVEDDATGDAWLGLRARRPEPRAEGS
jgi:ribosomal protein L11 methyltransferase